MTSTKEKPPELLSGDREPSLSADLGLTQISGFKRELNLETENFTKITLVANSI
jgi:hypothetical protein